jgi:hypothetical protein
MYNLFSVTSVKTLTVKKRNLKLYKPLRKISCPVSNDFMHERLKPIPLQYNIYNSIQYNTNNTNNTICTAHSTAGRASINAQLLSEDGFHGNQKVVSMVTKGQIYNNTLSLNTATD